MTTPLFPEPPVTRIAVTGHDAQLAVGRIFCVGRNYADHAREMGAEIIRDKPFFFLKGSHAAIAAGGEIAYAPETGNYHYEMELAVVLGRGGFRVNEAAAAEMVFGHACALDMTRRDLQQEARDMGRPWDLGKDVEDSAVIAPVAPGPVAPAAAIALHVNGSLRQDSSLDQMVWSVPELIAILSQYYHLRAGDMILTGTPAGVGPVAPGDRLEGTIDGLPPLSATIGARP